MRLAAAVLVLSLAPAAHAAGELRFVEHGRLLRAADRAALLAACPARRVAIEDPYYGRRVTYLASPLDCALRLGFGRGAAELGGADLVFRALDGYARPASAAQLAAGGGWLAFADADLTPDGGEPRFAPIDRRQVDPGPWYLVWERPEQADPHRWPWPYQLAAIEIASVEELFPHAVPRGEPKESPAWAGFAIFRRECIACHAMNGEGGSVGPELNVPRSIVEYRPRAQLAEFIRDPASFRYTQMPSNPQLRDADLEALLAYFDAMSRRKRDPKKASQASGTHSE